MLWRITNIKYPTSVQALLGLLRMLIDRILLFRHSFFHYTITHVALLCDFSQNRNANSTSFHLALENFYRVISAIRKETSSSQSENLGEWPQIKNGKLEKKLANIAKEVCETTCFQTKEQFKFLGYLSAAKLLVSEKNSDFCNDFPLKE